MKSRTVIAARPLANSRGRPITFFAMSKGAMSDRPMENTAACRMSGIGTKGDLPWALR